jgi:hypothetical protein
LLDFFKRDHNASLGRISRFAWTHPGHTARLLGRKSLLLTYVEQRLYEIVGQTFSALDEFRLTRAWQPLELKVGPAKA